jgi:hypothetical protein
MSRRTRMLQTSIALASVGILLGACGDTSDAAGKTGGVAASPSSGSSQLGDGRSTAEAVSLPGGVLALPVTPEGQEPAPLDAGRYRVPLGHSLAFEVDLPQGTTSNSDGLYLQSSPNVLKVEPAGQEYGVPVDPCALQSIEPAGRTVQDLVEAIRQEPIYRVSQRERVTIGGAHGTHLLIRIPAGYDASSCESSQVGLPGNPDTSNNMPPGYAGDWWILDVHGHRVVAQQLCDGCTAAQRERVARQVEHITFPRTR